ncbi:MAG: AMP-binding protein [Gammaproteobacteria bacterium]|nr:AMP-binding protein [Gammaproteobacteria bacterium]MDT8371457.1 AMP-binding protein [Gammaproteobacteria bacterium]
MTHFWSCITEYSIQKPNALALIGDHNSYSWAELYNSVIALSHQLHAYKDGVVALYADNSPAWVIIDLASRLADITLLPLPLFFSQQQLQHAIASAGTTAIIHQKDDLLSQLLSLSNASDINLNGFVIELCDDRKKVTLPAATGKITFTSGSTGQPKGVCLSNDQQIIVAESLLQASEQTQIRHLGILPFSTLLENIGGIYTPLLSGGVVIAVSQSTLGFNGNSGFDLTTFLSAISHFQPDSLIVLPELLLALVGAVKQGWQAPGSLKFIAVGGSRVATTLLEQAQQCGLPVYQGYGLSECCSVVSLNTPSASRIDSIGKVLPPCQVSIEKGEIIVSGNTFLGYIDQPDSWYQTQVATGDLGKLDQDGFLQIEGRKKNLLISSFGRNINPEWIESELLSNGLLQQCVVFGDAKPFCIALVMPRDNTTTNESIQLWIDHVNRGLPDYANIKQWIRLIKPLTFEQGLITSNGRPVRIAILSHFQHKIDSLYQGHA